MTSNGWVAAAAATALLGWLTACGANVEQGESGEGASAGSAGHGAGATTSTTSTITATGGTGGEGAGMPGGGGEGGCSNPSYPTNCAEVSYFECGFMAWCEDGTIRAEWHEHVEMHCGEFAEFWCEYECPHGCLTDEYTDWPENGAQLVEDLCAPGGSGSGGSGGA